MSVPAPAPGAPAAPAVAPPLLAGTALILAALNRLEARVAARLDTLDRRLAIVANQSRGAGASLPFQEVLLADGTLPSQPVPGARNALPPLTDLDSIRNLAAVPAGIYVREYGLVPAGVNLPAVGQRRVMIAHYIGCTVPL
ncbi:hypothetical protein R3P38DRAFT_1357940 [Favolaschia claudopus]|uniref:Mug135-like C-terminal domain-containing protein n=1 Tax=Favolaschia claudopus TaxID=2862362 RepID=A0AAW0DTS7_9AGAR